MTPMELLRTLMDMDNVLTDYQLVVFVYQELMRTTAQLEAIQESRLKK